MTTPQPRSWALDRPVNSPFGRPAGLAGRIAGRFMFYTNRQGELLDVLDVPPGARVLEVGYGPGALIRLLRERSPAAEICGVDPSPEMRALASRHNRDQAGRVDLRLGAAADTGFADERFDRVVSANNVAIWPDLQAGLRELHRVVRPGGTVLIAWHSRNAPSRIARTLGLPAEKLDLIQAGLEELFPKVTRHELTNVVAFASLR
ncbi:MAG: class I SAM-dependent methyltransferase [Carbonactinosporaceae bacterium]